MYEAIDALRSLGNLGAHPETDINIIVDVEPDEVSALIELVELFIEQTYIAGHEQQKKLDAVTALANAKKAERAEQTKANQFAKEQTSEL